MNEALDTWKNFTGEETASQPDRQSAWDRVVVGKIYIELLEGSPDCTTRARLLAVESKFFGAWLEAIPMQAIGTKMQCEAVRIAISLRLGL